MNRPVFLRWRRPGGGNARQRRTFQRHQRHSQGLPAKHKTVVADATLEIVTFDEIILLKKTP